MVKQPSLVVGKIAGLYIETPITAGDRVVVNPI